MSNKKHIDRLFQEKFKDFEVQPDAKVWQSIEKQLLETSVAKATVIPLWLKITAMAGVLVLGFTTAFLINSTATKNSNTIIVENENSSNENSNASEDRETKSILKSAENNQEAIVVSTPEAGTQNNSKNTIVSNTETNLDALNKTANAASSKLNDTNTGLTETNSNTQTVIGNVNNSEESSISGENNSTNNTSNQVSKNNIVASKNSNSNSSKTDASKLTHTETGLTQTKPYKNKNKITAGNANNSEENSIVSNGNNPNNNTTRQISKNNLAVVNSQNNRTNSQQDNNSNNVTNNNSSNKNTTTKTNRLDNNNNRTSTNAYNQASNSSYTANSNSTKENNTNTTRLINLSTTKQPLAVVNDSLVSGTIIFRNAQSIEEAIAATKKRIRKEEMGNRWVMSPNIAPVYYNAFGKGSQFGSQFSNNSRTGETNTSYGINLGYALTKNITIRSGISKLNLSYDTDNVIVFESISDTPIKPLENIDFYSLPNTQGLAVISTDNLAVQQVSGNLDNDAALSQRINYLEFPLEIEYKLNKSRFGINIIGGFSTFVLENNEVVSEFDGFKTDIGEANNINNLSFSANLGLGLNYKFSKSFVYNLEPTFKYQINGFSNTAGSFNPYIIGVYTGFSYKF